MPLGTFLGDSLALVNFSMLNESFDKKAFCELVALSEDQASVLQSLD